MMVRKILGLVVFVGAVGVAHAASFDCKLAKTREEKTICAKPALSALDDQMSAAYKIWSAAVDVAVKSNVLADQRAWVGRKTYQCKGGTADDLATCLTLVYQERIDQLKGRVVTMGGVQFVGQAIFLKAKDNPSDGVAAADEQVPGFGVLAAVWPMAVSDAPEWKRWNDGVLAEVKRIAMPDGSKLDPTSVPWSNAWAAGFDAEMNYTMKEAGQGRVSVSWRFIRWAMVHRMEMRCLRTSIGCWRQDA